MATTASAQERSPLLSPTKPVKTDDDDHVVLCGDDLWAPKAMYTVFSGSTSALLNYLPVYYEKIMLFDKFQIGILQTVPCVCAFVAPPFWGAVADRFRAHRAIMIMSIVTGGIIMYAMRFTSSFYIACALIFLSNFQQQPGSSLLDLAIMEMITKYGGEYGKQRLFGAVGWGATAYFTGLIVASYGVVQSFNVYVLLLCASLYVLHFIPVATQQDDDAAVDAESDARASFWSGIATLWREHKDMLVLLIVVFLMGLMYGVLSSFLTLNFYNLSGGNAHIIGVAIMCETISELPAFFYSQKLIDRVGIVNVLLLSIGAYFLRITYYAVMVNPWTAIPFEFLHGVTFGIAWAACTQYVFASSPRAVAGTTLGLLNGIQNGLGKGTGTLVGGWIYEHWGPRVMWWITDLGVPLSLLGVFVFAILKPKEQVETEEGFAEAEQIDKV